MEKKKIERRGKCKHPYYLLTQNTIMFLLPLLSLAKIIICTDTHPYKQCEFYIELKDDEMCVYDIIFFLCRIIVEMMQNKLIGEAETGKIPTNMKN